MKRIDLEIGDLHAFLAVAEKLSFRAAAEELFISQPALSRRIEKLEAATGARLLDRTSRRVALTEAGRTFLPHACSIAEELDVAIHGVSASRLQRAGLVTIACVPSVAHHVLPNLLKSFSEQYPKVRIKVIDESGEDVLQSVVSAVADFGVNFTGAQETDIEFRAAYTERYLVAVRRDHHLAKRKSIAWRDLADETFVSVSSRSSNRLLLDNAMAKMAKRPVISYEVNHVTGALGMVAAGLGVAVVPALALSADHYPSIIGIPLVQPVVSRTLGFITRKGSVLSPPAQALLNMLQKAARQGFV
jgi:DNA-binding transcriptional LysR family regulator